MKRWLLAALVLIVVAVLGLYLVARHALGSEILRRQLEQQLSARLGEPVRIAAASARLFPGVAVDLHDVTVGNPVSLQLERVRVFTGIRALFADAVDIRRIAVSNGRPGAAGSPVAFDLEASLLGDRLDVQALTVRGPTTTIEATGVLTSVSRVQGTFDAHAQQLDLSELVAMAAAVTPRSAHTPGRQPVPMHLSVHVSTPRLRFGADEFRALSTTIDAVPGRVAMDGLSLQLFGGSFKGRLDADTRGVPPVLRLNGTVADLDVAGLLQRTGSAGGVTGRLSGTVALSGRGEDGTSLVHTAAGTIDASIRNGTLPHLDMVRTVVLAFGKPASGAQGSGTAFETLSGAFALAAGTLRSDNLALRSRDVDVNGHGTITIASGALDLRGDVVLSRELTAQAGTDLRRYAQEDGRVIVPATVGGTLDHPSVFVDVAAAAKRAVGNELKRRATDFLGGLFKKKKKGGGG